jgi:HDOD domain
MPLDPVIRDRLAQLIERGELPLPLLPEAASQVMVLVDRPDCDTRRLADVIRRDPALTAHVLRIASHIAEIPTGGVHGVMRYLALSGRRFDHGRAVSS